MAVLAFLTDPDVVAKILRHLRLPTSAPAVTAAKSATPALGFDLPEEEFASKQDGDDAGESHPQRGHGGREGKAVPRRLGNSGISGAEPAVAGHKPRKMLLAIGSMDAGIVHGASMGALRRPGGVQLSYQQSASSTDSGQEGLG
jgi:hypothetical protein